MWAAHRGGIDIFAGDRCEQVAELRRQSVFDLVVVIVCSFSGMLADRRRESDLAHRGNERDDRDAVYLAQVEFCDCACGNAA